MMATAALPFQSAIAILNSLYNSLLFADSLRSQSASVRAPD